MTDTPQFARPKRPVVGPLLVLHRKHDGYIAFARETETGDWQDLYSVRVCELDGWFPELVTDLEADSYFSINAFWRPADWASKFHPQLRGAHRKIKDLRWLVACFVDLDVYKLDLTVGQVIGAIIDLQEEGHLLPPSLFQRSGRGLWLFWMLMGEGTQPVEAFWGKRLLYARVQKAIATRLAGLGADMQATDGARLARIPGSLHRVAQRRVTYWFQTDQNDLPYYYRLQDLARFFGVPELEPAPPQVATVFQTHDHTLRTGKKPNRGWAALNDNRLRQLVTLESLRGGYFSKGRRRHWAALLYANFLAKARTPSRDLWAALLAFGNRCRPPLRDRAIQDAIKQGRKLSKLSNQKIADCLDITPDEAANLETWSPASLYGAKRQRLPVTPPRQEALKHRQASILHYVNDCKERRESVPSIRQMQALLADQGIEASFRTVLLDYQRLGIENPRGRQARERQKSRLPFG